MHLEIPEKDPEKIYIRVPVPKASRKGDPASIEICLSDLPEDVLKEVYLQGCKTLVNRGMSKITGEKDEKSVKVVMDIAAENLQNMYEGKVRMSAGVRTKITGAVKTEAMRIARQVVKDGIQAEGKKISHYSPKEISAAAAQFLDLDEGKWIWDEAKQAVEARQAKKNEPKEGLKNVVAGLQEDPELVRKAEEAKAKRKRPSKEEAKVDLAAAAHAGARGRQGQHVAH